MTKVSAHFRSIKVSEKLPTHCSPKPAFCPKWGGVGGQFPKNVN